MAHIMHVNVVDSEKQIFNGDVEYLIAPASMGEVGIYPHHIPLISKLKAGLLRMQLPGETQQVILAISGGFLEVKDNQATVLADVVERTDALDEARLIEQKTAALAKIKHSASSPTHDIAKAQASLEIAIAQLKAVEYIKKHSKH